MKFSTESREEQHSKWIESIRETIWVWTKSECEMVPSNDALVLYWKRSCWVVHTWREANRAQQVSKPLAENGWEIVTVRFRWCGIARKTGCEKPCETANRLPMCDRM